MSVLKLWIIEQDQESGWDTYDSAVVAAETEEEAKAIHPSGRWDKPYHDWAHSPDQVKATLIGNAHESLNPGDVICSSFNAG